VYTRRTVIVGFLLLSGLSLVGMPETLSQARGASLIEIIFPLLLDSDDQVCVDADKDGYFEQDNCGQAAVDCDDGDPEVYPGAQERCDDKDNDCDAEIDEEGATGCTTYYLDNDNDGYGTSGSGRCLCAPSGGYTSTQDGDCNDSEAAVNPGASEDCDDGIDNDCDGKQDEQDSDCSQCLDPSYNDTCANTTYLGTIREVDGEVTLTATIYPQDDVDYFRFEAEEGTSGCIPFMDQDLTVRIRLTPPQGADCRDYDLHLYDEQCSSLESSQGAACDEEVIIYTWDGMCGMDDSRYFRVAVEPWAGAFSCTSYTIVIDMWEE